MAGPSRPSSSSRSSTPKNSAPYEPDVEDDPLASLNHPFLYDTTKHNAEHGTDALVNETFSSAPFDLSEFLSSDNTSESWPEGWHWGHSASVGLLGSANDGPTPMNLSPTPQPVAAPTLQQTADVSPSATRESHVLLQGDRQSRHPQKQTFSCPIRDYEEAHKPTEAVGWRYPCTGTTANSMAEVRQHIQRSHRIEFLKLCRTCNEHSIDEDDFRANHGDDGLQCDNPKPQLRGPAQKEQWKKLYDLVPDMQFKTTTSNKQPQPNLPGSRGPRQQSASDQLDSSSDSFQSREHPGFRSKSAGRSQYDSISYQEASELDLQLNERTIEETGSEGHPRTKLTMTSSSSSVPHTFQRSHDLLCTDISPYFAVPGETTPTQERWPSTYHQSALDSSRDIPRSHEFYNGAVEHPSPGVLTSGHDVSTPSGLFNMAVSGHTSYSQFIQGPYVLCQSASRSQSTDRTFSNSESTKQAASALHVLQASSMVPSNRRRGGSVSSVESEESSAPDPIMCCFCGRTYSGEYRKGNLARHKRQKHGEAQQVYPCEAADCSQQPFKRQDARLKHYRRHHSWLAPGEPLLRK